MGSGRWLWNLLLGCLGKIRLHESMVSIYSFHFLGNAMHFYSSATENQMYSQLVGIPIGMILTSTIRTSWWDSLSLHFMYLMSCEQFVSFCWVLCTYFDSPAVWIFFLLLSSFSNGLHICEPIKHVSQRCERTKEVSHDHTAVDCDKFVYSFKARIALSSTK